MSSQEADTCPSCSSKEQHSDFCTKCGAEINQKPDSFSNIPIFLKILIFPFSLIVVVYHFSTVILIFPLSLIFTLIKKISSVTLIAVRLIAGLLAGLFFLLCIFVIFMFVGFFLFSDEQGRPFGLAFSDEQGRPFGISIGGVKNFEGQVREIYDNCEDDSSSLSLVFFNINTNRNELWECLRQEVSYGILSQSFVFSADTIYDGHDIPRKFKEIIRDSQQRHIAEAKEKILYREYEFTPYGFSEKEISKFVENFDSHCQTRGNFPIQWRPPFSRCEEAIHYLIVIKQEELMYRCNKNEHYYTFYRPEQMPFFSTTAPPVAPEELCPANERPPSLR